MWILFYYRPNTVSEIFRDKSYKQLAALTSTVEVRSPLEFVNGSANSNGLEILCFLYLYSYCIICSPSCLIINPTMLRHKSIRKSSENKQDKENIIILYRLVYHYEIAVVGLSRSVRRKWYQTWLCSSTHLRDDTHDDLAYRYLSLRQIYEIRPRVR